jgi:hypothetical protein
MARPASTYRAARRNACMRPDPKTTTAWGPPWYFQGSKKARRHRAHYGVAPVMSSSKTYRGPVLSQCERAQRDAGYVEREPTYEAAQTEMQRYAAWLAEAKMGAA